MPRKPRNDYPGGIFHVVNRGVARRSIFESERDRRYFLSRLAWCVKREMVEIIAYCLMANHFHLLLRSMVGDLAGVMHWVQNLHARRFNRLRGRDGPLFRGRYKVGEIKSLTCLAGAFVYVHANPVKAQIVSAPHLYRHSSAWNYRQNTFPPWLHPEPQFIQCPPRRQVADELIEGWLRSPDLEPAELDELIAGTKHRLK